MVVVSFRLVAGRPVEGRWWIQGADTGCRCRRRRRCSSSSSPSPLDVNVKMESMESMDLYSPPLLLSSSMLLLHSPSSQFKGTFPLRAARMLAEIITTTSTTKAPPPPPPPPTPHCRGNLALPIRPLKCRARSATALSGRLRFHYIS